MINLSFWIISVFSVSGFCCALEIQWHQPIIGTQEEAQVIKNFNRVQYKQSDNGLADDSALLNLIKDTTCFEHIKKEIQYCIDERIDEVTKRARQLNQNINLSLPVLEKQTFLNKWWYEKPLRYSNTDIEFQTVVSKEDVDKMCINGLANRAQLYAQLYNQLDAIKERKANISALHIELLFDVCESLKPDRNKNENNTDYFARNKNDKFVNFLTWKNTWLGANERLLVRGDKKNANLTNALHTIIESEYKNRLSYASKWITTHSGTEKEKSLCLLAYKVDETSFIARIDIPKPSEREYFIDEPSKCAEEKVNILRLKTQPQIFFCGTGKIDVIAYDEENDFILRASGGELSWLYKNAWHIYRDNHTICKFEQPIKRVFPIAGSAYLVVTQGNVLYSTFCAKECRAEKNIFSLPNNTIDIAYDEVSKQLAILTEQGVFVYSCLVSKPTQEGSQKLKNYMQKVGASRGNAPDVDTKNWKIEVQDCKAFNNDLFDYAQHKYHAVDFRNGQVYLKYKIKNKHNNDIEKVLIYPPLNQQVKKSDLQQPATQSASTHVAGAPNTASSSSISSSAQASNELDNVMLNVPTCGLFVSGNTLKRACGRFENRVVDVFTFESKITSFCNIDRYVYLVATEDRKIHSVFYYTSKESQFKEFDFARKPEPINLGLPPCTITTMQYTTELKVLTLITSDGDYSVQCELLKSGEEDDHDVYINEISFLDGLKPLDDVIDWKIQCTDLRKKV